MTNYWDGLVSGFVATVALSTPMLLKGMMGAMPELDPVGMLSGMMGKPENRATCWMAHFAIGTIAWGLLFAFFAPSIPGPYWLRGVIFAAGAWALMMIGPMPMGLGIALDPAYAKARRSGWRKADTRF